jgi:hypothetical protein
MSFNTSLTFAISGPNKLPRFKSWAETNAPEIPVSLPPQVPSASESLTIRLKSVTDRDTLAARLTGVKI